MKLRSYLLIANGVSIGVILIALFVCYHYMLLHWDQTVLLGSVTVGAALISAIVHAFMTRPLESSLHKLTAEASRVAEGNFGGEVPLLGPLEFRQLSAQFTDMSGKLRDSFERLHSSEASRRELVANVSHDLRTPMASIQAFVEALQDDVIQDRETFDRYLQTIRLETHRLSRLIDDLFQLSQLHADAVVWAPELCHADSLVVEALQSLSLQLDEKRLEVDVRMPERLPPLYAMPYEVKRVLANLLQNAIRHSPPEGKLTLKAELVSGGNGERADSVEAGIGKKAAAGAEGEGAAERMNGTMAASGKAGTAGMAGTGRSENTAEMGNTGNRRIMVNTKNSGDTKVTGNTKNFKNMRIMANSGDTKNLENIPVVRFSVTDEGEGVSAEDRERIFERFYRADRSRSRAGGGAGLGLAIAASIVAMHGGAIGVDSEPGSGSRFWFTIPIAR